MGKLKNWIHYYKTSLTDGSRGGKDSNSLIAFQNEELQLSNIPQNELLKIWEEKEIFEINYSPKNASEKRDEDTFVEVNKIRIAPIYIEKEITEIQKSKNNTPDLPFWIPAYVDKEGNLYPPKEGETPIFARNFLAPTPENSLSIAELEKVDEVIKYKRFEEENWIIYWNDCEDFFKEVSGKGYIDFQENKTFQFYFCKLDDCITTHNIQKLYESLQKEKKLNECKVLKKILYTDAISPNHQLDEVEIFLPPYHFGQMNGNFPLSYSQRIAFAQFSSKYNTDVFAINGPPGTGKTTILQSVIANLITQSVLEQRDTPLLVGCSTNNQAITNILDSMNLKETEDILPQRWLPDVKSFGLYLASNAKAEKAQKKYQIVTNNFLKDNFVKKLEDKSRISEYEVYFKEKFQKYFETNEEEITLESLYEHIKFLQDKIQNVTEIARKKHQTNTHNPNKIKQELQEIKNCVLSKNKEYQLLEEVTSNLKKRHSELPLLSKLSILPLQKYKDIRVNAYRRVLQPISNRLPKNFKEWSEYNTIISYLDNLAFNLQEEIATLKQKQENLISIEKNIEVNDNKYQNFLNIWQNKYNEKWRSLVENTREEYQDLGILEDTAVKLDISYRYELFWLCVHYREWQYIQELKEIEENDKERGKVTYENKLRRLAKVTPLFISTFHSLPKFCNYYSPEEGVQFYKNLFDLMIVDESGQVSPEIAIPSLSLTKKLLAVGDEYQIEPVWNISTSLDYLNAKKYSLIEKEEDFKQLTAMGFLSSNGNLMRLVKKSTPFSFIHKNGEKEKGAYLLEHRRCVDSIIQYSKENVYKGSLELMVGDIESKLPPLGYIHIDGFSEQHNGYSRKNIKEALTIIQWLLNKQEQLQATYKKSISDILAIITPFSAQKKVLKDLLFKHLGKELAANITIGTVHALQGAERPIILFSAVHDKKDKSLFYDYHGKFNMLNVALTRAKHSFIVFANMAIFNPEQNSPSGKLAKLLFSNDKYALGENFIFKSKIVHPPQEGLKSTRIDTLEKHREILKRCFEVSEKELIIFTPFISKRAIEVDNIEKLINETTQRGVRVKIITDKHLDKDPKNKNGLKEHSKEGREILLKTEAELLIINGIHNKTICVDDKIIIDGSFNWLSAVRDKNSPYFREETSWVVQEINENIADGKVQRIITGVKERFQILK